jgi:hypothetical protein
VLCAAGERHNSHALWHVGVGGWRPELGLEGHHSSPGRETRDGRGKGEVQSAFDAHGLCCARARCRL